MLISEPAPAPPPPVLAGLMSSRGQAVPRGLVQPSVDEILAATNATRSRAYEVKAQIDALLQTLARPPGRPRVERPSAPATDPSLVGLLAEVFDYVMQHPGCVQGGQRVRYSDEYRQFVLELRERHVDVAAAERPRDPLPLGTLEDWLRCARPATVAAAAAPPSAAPSADEPAAAERNAQQAQIETVLTAARVAR